MAVLYAVEEHYGPYSELVMCIALVTLVYESQQANAFSMALHAVEPKKVLCVRK